MRNNTTSSSDSTGTITSLSPSFGARSVLLQRDGQTAQMTATAQYQGFAIGDRVTIRIIGTQVYATGLIR